MAGDGTRIRGIDDPYEVLRLVDDMSDMSDMSSDSESDEDGGDGEDSGDESDEEYNVSVDSSDDENQSFYQPSLPSSGAGGGSIAMGRGRPRSRARPTGRVARIRGRARGRIAGQPRSRSRSPLPTSSSSSGRIWEPLYRARSLVPFAERSGAQRRYDNPTELEMFEEFFTAEIWSFLVDMTNLNASNMRLETWKPIDIKELKAFIALIILMGIIKMPCLEDYWQKTYWIFDVGSINKIMPRNRFSQIWKCLHCCDESNAPDTDDPQRDKLYKIRPFMNLLLPRFETVYVPSQNISIDESMIPFKGRIGFRQFIPSKRVRFGIKVWVLAESSTGYVSRLQVYTGKDWNASPAVGLSTRVVNDLILPYEGKGYHLYLDNFYSSVDLFASLFERKVYACGTLRKGRKNTPEDIYILDPRRRERGYTKWVMSGPILAQSWLDKKPVYFLTTIHKPEHEDDATESQKSVKRRGGRGQGAVTVPCPPLLQPYNVGMGGVDLNDRQRKYYNLGRRSKKWYRRVFYYMLEVTLHNTTVLYRNLGHPRYSRRLPERLRMELVTQLVGDTRAKQGGVKRRSDASSHLPGLQNPTAHLPVMTDTVRRCKVCSKKASVDPNEYVTVPRSKLKCQECDVYLCVKSGMNCFAAWHTQVEYWRD